jgi:hypothetical protein
MTLRKSVLKLGSEIVVSIMAILPELTLHQSSCSKMTTHRHLAIIKWDIQKIILCMDTFELVGVSHLLSDEQLSELANAQR